MRASWRSSTSMSPRRALPCPHRVISIPSRASQPGVASLEIDTRLVADSDAAERTIHFRLGAARTVRAVKVAEDLIFDVDDSNHIAGVWLLNVPPFPTDK